MCYTVEYVEQRAARIAERFRKLFPEEKIKSIPAQLPMFYLVSGFQHPELPIIKENGIFLYEWGLIPSWVKDAGTAHDIQNKTLNAMGETVFEKPSFRHAIEHRRCLLPVNGFYEWREVNNKKYPYLVQLKSNEIFSMGCIYETWINKETGEEKNTFTVLTTPANSLMEKIHNLKRRMPLIIAEHDEEKWINPALPANEINQLIKPYDTGDMKAYTISQDANNVRNQRNIPSILNPVSYPEIPELLW